MGRRNETLDVNFKYQGMEGFQNGIQLKYNEFCFRDSVTSNFRGTTSLV